jgi:hexokinase
LNKVSGKNVFCRQELEDFARYYGFHYDSCQMSVLVQDFCLDMDRGLKGMSSGMPMIPAHIGVNKKLQTGKTVLALDAGGTNLRAALVSFNDAGNPVTKDLRKGAMPGTQGRLSAVQFFDALADICAPFLENAGNEISGIGFCFSYNMEMMENGDGIVLAFSKEVDAPEVVGKAVGAGLRDALAKRNIKTPDKIVLLNDTAATLLAGLTQLPAQFPSVIYKDNVPPKKFDVAPGPVIGFILGTGFNTAYPETTIPKIGFHSASDPQIVICESGNFYNRYQGRIDREFDATTKKAGSYNTEKMTAGAYLGPLSLFILKHAVQDGVLRFKNQDKLLAMETLQTKDLNQFLQAPLALDGTFGSLFGADECDAIASVVFLESIITERAAIFSAATLAGVVEHIDGAHDPLAPLRIAVEGTTFSIYHFLRRSLEARLRAMLSKETPRFYIIDVVEQASLSGAAVAAL